MELLFIVAFLALADRAIPANLRRFAGDYFTSTPEDYWARYGLISFPRTALAVLLCLLTALHMLRHSDLVAWLGVAVSLIYAGSAGLDALRAGRPRT
jgi:hypothetical protein